MTGIEFLHQLKFATAFLELIIRETESENLSLLGQQMPEAAETNLNSTCEAISKLYKLGCSPIIQVLPVYKKPSWPKATYLRRKPRT